MILGSYVPGTSVLHRAPVWLKLLVLCALMVGLFWFRSPVTVLCGAALVLVGCAVSGVGVLEVGTRLRPMLWFLVPLTVLQGVWVGPVRAVVLVGSLLVAVGLATLVTLTTREQDLLDAVVAATRPLRPIGVDPERVALVLALTVRSIPVVAALATQVQQARKARGAERSARAFAVPLLVRTVRHADRLGEALQARGVDDG